MRIGIMSFAHLHAEGYIHNLRANPDIKFVGFADNDLARGKHFADLFNATLFNSYEELLAQNLDGVVVCSENANHYPLVKMAAEAGIHVLSEKPLATTLQDAQQMVEICENQGVKLMTAFPMRFSTPLREVKNAIESGKLGQIYGFNATNQGECPKYHRDWFVDKKLAGGGSVMDHTVHLADVLRWFLGSEVVEVYADINRILYADQVAEDVETGGLIMLTFDNGVFASIDCSWSKPPYYPTWGGLGMELVAADGLVTVDAFRQVMTRYSHSTQRPVYDFWGSDPNQLMIDEFVACVQEDREPLVTGYDGYKAVEIALAVYDSVEAGQPVRLPVA